MLSSLDTLNAPRLGSALSPSIGLAASPRLPAGPADALRSLAINLESPLGFALPITNGGLTLKLNAGPAVATPTPGPPTTISSSTSCIGASVSNGATPSLAFPRDVPSRCAEVAIRGTFESIEADMDGAGVKNDEMCAEAARMRSGVSLMRNEVECEWDEA